MIFIGKSRACQIIFGLSFILLYTLLFKSFNKYKQYKIIARIYILGIIVKIIDSYNIYINSTIEYFLSRALPFEMCDFALGFVPIAFIYLAKHDSCQTINRILVYTLLPGQIIDILSYVLIFWWDLTPEYVEEFFYVTQGYQSYNASGEYMDSLFITDENNFIAHFIQILLIALFIQKSDFFKSNPYKETYKTYISVLSMILCVHIINLILLACGVTGTIMNPAQANYMYTIDSWSFYRFFPYEIRSFIFNIVKTPIIYGFFYIAFLYLALIGILSSLHYLVYKLYYKKRGLDNIFYQKAVNDQTGLNHVRYI